jgi:hypothetical protein
MPNLFLALAAAGAAAAMAPPAASPLPSGPPAFLGDGGCKNPIRVIPADGPAEAEPNKLAELPPGDLVLSVLRTEDGCPAPVVVGQGYGAVGAVGGRAAPSRRMPLRAVPAPYGR